MNLAQVNSFQELRVVLLVVPKTNRLSVPYVCLMCIVCARRQRLQDNDIPPKKSRPALDKFKGAVRRVISLLQLRKKWAAYGKVLQETPRKFLWEGLERKKGVLKRVKKLTTP